jgi:hypothetical protein
MSLLKQPYDLAPNVKILINLGALLDIPTGFYLKGKYGESILNGGLGLLTGVVGIGNNFKSTIMSYMMLSAAYKIAYASETSMNTYDTEINIHESRLNDFAQRFPLFHGRDIIDEQIWTVTDKTVYYANEWYERAKDFMKQKYDNAKKLERDTPFLSRDKQTLMRIVPPTFGAVDSFSRFETEDVAQLQDENQLGDSGGNTVHMRQGLAKMRFLIEIPTLTGRSYHYMLLTAHIGKEGPAMQTGPVPVPPPKKLQYLKNGDKLKGVTEQFTFLMSNCWHAYDAKPLLNQGTKGPEYPRDTNDNRPMDTDLNIVSLRQLRGKAGQSGMVIELIVSQEEGVLPELSEFHFLKSNKFGFSGNDRTYCLDLYPDCSLSRPTIRNKIDTDKGLCRALNITAEMCQMQMLWKVMDEDVRCTPKELYEDLKAQGYDWDVLLNTRGWWTLDNDKQDIPFLSTMDLLRMRKGLYFPYWLEDDKKTIKSKFQKK